MRESSTTFEIESVVVVVVTFLDAPVPDAVDTTHEKEPVAVACVPTYLVTVVAVPLTVTDVVVVLGGLLGHAPPPYVVQDGFESTGIVLSCVCELADCASILSINAPKPLLAFEYPS